MIGTKFYKPLQENVIRWTTEENVFDAEGNQLFDENGQAITQAVEHEKANDAPNTLAKYQDAAEWCNANKAFIEDKGDYYEVVAIPEPTAEELKAQALANAKSERAAEVEALTVEVDGMVFDADEVSQQRVARSIVALQEGETMPWVLYDNTIVQVNKSQLMQVLRLAGQKQCELWVKPYTG